MSPIKQKMGPLDIFRKGYPLLQHCLSGWLTDSISVRCEGSEFSMDAHISLFNYSYCFFNKTLKWV